MADISREELDRLYQTLDAGFSGVHSRLDELNGRTRKAENAIAILEDRGHPAAWGGGLGAVIVGIVEGARWMLGK